MRAGAQQTAMFVGHGLLVLAVVSAVAAWRGLDAHRALILGVLAAGFATLPDVDVLYPLLAVLAGAGPLWDAPAEFWRLSTTVHRGATHSLVVGLWTALAVTLWAGGGASRPARAPRPALVSRLAPRWRDRLGARVAAVAALGALVVTVGVAAGALAAAMVAVMAVGALTFATLGVRAGFGARELGAAALVGLASHPFGDLFTGQPPPFLFPLQDVFTVDATVFGSRLALHGDPTLHLVGAFLVELAMVWVAVGVVALLLARRPWTHVRPRALAGLGFAVAVFAIPAPSLSAATGFVAGALAVGVVGVPLQRRPSRDHCWDAVCTALVAVTLGVVSYGVAYAVL